MSRRDVFARPGGERPHISTPSVAFAVTRLVRGSEPLERGVEVTRRLVEIVQSLPAGSVVDLTIGRLRRTGAQVRIEAHGPVPPTFVGDARWALHDVAEIAPCRAAPVDPPTHLAELRAACHGRPWAVVSETHEYSDLVQSDAVQSELLRQRAARLRTPWPRARYADLAALLSLNEASPRGVAASLIMRHRLSPAGPVDHALLAEHLHGAWDPSHGDPHEYLGRPVRLRTLIGSTTGPLPGRVEALLRRWANDVELVEFAADMRAEAWHGDASSLAQHAVPFGQALAFVRVPVAARAFPGMPTSEPVVALRPLDPVPARPRSAIRLGRARSATGRWTDVQVDQLDLAQHCFVQGASGSGKSTLLAAIALAVQASGASYTLLDPEGSTVDALIRQTDLRHVDQVSVVRHGHDELDVPLNLLAGDPSDIERIVDLFAEVVQQSQDPTNQGVVGPRWRRWFTLIARATVLVYGKDATLVAVAALASDMNRVRQLAEAVGPIDPELAHRLQAEYGSLGRDNAADLVSWGVSKLGMLLTSERARWIFGAGPDAIDVCSAMDEGMSLLIDLGAHRLGEPVGRIIGASYLLKFWAALARRRRPDRMHYLIVDEAHVFSYGPLPKLLAEARKFGVGVVVATQHLGQLTGELADALESNTGCFMSLRCGLQSASRASARLDGWPVTELVRLPTLVAAASITRDGIVSPPFNLQIDHHSRVRRLERAGRVGPHIGDRIIAACRAEVSSAYAGLETPGDRELLSRLNRPGTVPGSRRRPVEVPMPTASGILDDWQAARLRRDSAGRVVGTDGS